MMRSGSPTQRATPDCPAGLSNRRPWGPAGSPGHITLSLTGHPPLDGAGVAIQPPHALQGGRVGQQVRGEAGIFQHEEHVHQLFKGALRRASQGEGLGWPAHPGGREPGVVYSVDRRALCHHSVQQKCWPSWTQDHIPQEAQVAGRGVLGFWG